MIYLRWSGVQVSRHLHTLVMLHLETKYPDVLPEFVESAFLALRSDSVLSLEHGRPIALPRAHWPGR